MKVQAKHGKVTQNMHGASRNYRYVWDVSLGAQVHQPQHSAHPSIDFYHLEDPQQRERYSPQANDYGLRPKHSGALHEFDDPPPDEALQAGRTRDKALQTTTE